MVKQVTQADASHAYTLYMQATDLRDYLVLRVRQLEFDSATGARHAARLARYRTLRSKARVRSARRYDAYCDMANVIEGEGVNG